MYKIRKHFRYPLIIPHIILIVLIIPTILIYNYITELKDISVGESVVDTSFNSMIAEYINNDVLVNTIEKTTIDSNIISNNILNKLSKVYINDMDKLKYDINNPNDNLPIYSIFREEMEQESDFPYINKFICMENGIITDLNKKINEYKDNSWKTIIESKPNRKIATLAVNNIIKLNKDFTIWQVKYDERINDIDYIDNKILYNLVSQYGTDILKSFNGLVSSYITDNGDIFGNKDINNLSVRQDNYKIIIVEEFNLYDMFLYNKKINNTYCTIVDSRDRLKLYLSFYEKERIKTFIIVGFAFIVLAISLMTIQNQKIDNNKKW